MCLRSGNTTATVSVNYATSNGTALAGRDYVPASGTLTFQPGQTLATFAVTILPNTAQATGTRTLNLTLSQPSRRGSLRLDHHGDLGDFAGARAPRPACGAQLFP